MTRLLRNMKSARQVEAVELMVASNTTTVGACRRTTEGHAPGAVHRLQAHRA